MTQESEEYVTGLPDGEWAGTIPLEDLRREDGKIAESIEGHQGDIGHLETVLCNHSTGAGLCRECHHGSVHTRMGACKFSVCAMHRDDMAGKDCSCSGVWGVPRRDPAPTQLSFDFKPRASRLTGPVYHHIRTGADGRSGAGVTLCILPPLPLSDPPLYPIGMAICSARDQFSRKRGRQIALGRAALAASVYVRNGCGPVRMAEVLRSGARTVVAEVGLLRLNGNFWQRLFKSGVVYESEFSPLERKIVGLDRWDA